jgi:hypothetical protein
LHAQYTGANINIRLTVEARRMRIPAGDAEDGNPGPTGRTALYTRRGHFRDYSRRGLFGKHRGDVWQPATVRGSATRGRILKDLVLHLTSEEDTEWNPVASQSG